MACDLETTIEESCTSGIGKIQDPIMLLKIIAYLMCEIADSGGGGGAQEVYIGRDPAPPDDPTKPALSFPSGGGTLTQWDVNSQTWV